MKNGSNPSIVPKDETEQTTMYWTAYHGNLTMIKTIFNHNNQYKFSYDWVCFLLLPKFTKNC